MVYSIWYSIYKDPTEEDIWCLSCIGPLNQNVISLCLQYLLFVGPLLGPFRGRELFVRPADPSENREASTQRFKSLASKSIEFFWNQRSRIFGALTFRGKWSVVGGVGIQERWDLGSPSRPTTLSGTPNAMKWRPEGLS